MMCSHAQIHTAVVNHFQLNSHFSKNYSQDLGNIRILVKTFMGLGQSYDLQNLGLPQYDAEGGVLDCFNSSEKLCIFNPIFCKS